MSDWRFVLLSFVAGSSWCTAVKVKHGLGEDSVLRAAGSDLVFDIGLNRGDDTRAYLDMGYKVVAVEANPHYAKKGEITFAEEIRQGRLIILNRALSDTVNKTVHFYTPEMSKALQIMRKISPMFDVANVMVGASDAEGSHTDELASMSKANACVGCFGNLQCTCKQIAVQTTTCGDLIKQYGTPNFLKVDIEGFDGLCIQDLAKLPCALLPPYISFEEQDTHQVRTATSSELIKAMSPRGYTWKVTRQKWSEHAVKGSGAFGEEAQDFVIGQEWSDGVNASTRANLKCWMPGYTMEYDCDVHGKHNPSSCLEG